MQQILKPIRIWRQQSRNERGKKGIMRFAEMKILLF